MLASSSSWAKLVVKLSEGGTGIGIGELEVVQDALVLTLESDIRDEARDVCHQSELHHHTALWDLGVFRGREQADT